jgi:hypothetical protein
MPVWFEENLRTRCVMCDAKPRWQPGWRVSSDLNSISQSTCFASIFGVLDQRRFLLVSERKVTREPQVRFHGKTGVGGFHDRYASRDSQPRASKGGKTVGGRRSSTCTGLPAVE